MPARCLSSRLFACLMLTLGLGRAGAASAELDFEAKLKTAYIVNFIRYIDWQRSLSNVRLCVSPTADIHSYALPLQQRNLDGGRVLTVIDNFVDLQGCDIFYENGSMAESGFDLSLTPDVLAISDSRLALARGFHIQFFLRNLKLRFSISRANLDAANFEISSKLLRLSRDVE